jgi:hypothetical protein
MRRFSRPTYAYDNGGQNVSVLAWTQSAFAPRRPRESTPILTLRHRAKGKEREPRFALLDAALRVSDVASRARPRNEPSSARKSAQPVPCRQLIILNLLWPMENKRNGPRESADRKGPVATKRLREALLGRRWGRAVRGAPVPHIPIMTHSSAGARATSAGRDGSYAVTERRGTARDSATGVSSGPAEDRRGTFN